MKFQQPFLALLLLLTGAALAAAQGTMRITFERQPRGTVGTISGRVENGMTFWNPKGVNP